MFCFHLFFFRNKKEQVPTFSALSFFFSFSLQSSSRFTFIHAHKCTHKTHSITLNNAQRHKHVLIRSSTYFTKPRDSAECVGRRGSTASISDSWSCAIGNERKRFNAFLDALFCLINIGGKTWFLFYFSLEHVSLARRSLFSQFEANSVIRFCRCDVL